MEELREILENQLEMKRRFYNESLGLFIDTTDAECEFDLFERNAINDLLILHKTKVEIQQLKEIITIINMLH